MKKLVIISILILVFFSCKDNSTEPNGEPSPKSKFFSIEVGELWTYENSSGKEATIRIARFDTSEWVLSFWDTTSKIKLPTYHLTYKYLDNSLPRYEDLALALTDSGYVFGTYSHSIVAPNYPTDFPIKLYLIPDTVHLGYTETMSFSKPIGSKDYNWLATAVWTESSSILFDDTLRESWNIDFNAKSEYPVQKLMGNSYTWLAKVGLYKIYNYTLIKKEKP